MTLQTVTALATRTPPCSPLPLHLFVGTRGDEPLPVPTQTLSRYGLRRLGTTMETVPGHPLELEGVLNPAVARGPDGHLYLLPRLVGAGNFSRIGLARVLVTRRGEPHGVQRMGVARASLAQLLPFRMAATG